MSRHFSVRFIVSVAVSLLLQGIAWAQNAAPTHVEYVQSIAVSDLQKLLGVDGDTLYVSRKSGTVDALEVASGKLRFSLQSQDVEGKKLLGQPEAVVVAGDTIYVLDSDRNRIAMFGASGNLQGKFKGALSASSSVASLSSPQGMTVFNGIVYVADTGNHRIQRYGDNGVFLGTLPIDSANTMLDDTSYKLDKPIAVGVNVKGEIFVLDGASGVMSDKSRVKVYAQDGRYLRALTKNGKPTAMQLSDSTTYVADAQNYAVQRYDAQGKLTETFGSRGDGRAQFQSIVGLAFDAGNIYVGDAKRGMVHHFLVPQEPGNNGEQQADLPPSVHWQQSFSLAANRIAWNGKDTLVAIARDKSNVLLRYQDGQASELPLNKSIKPTALAYDKQGALWIVERSNDKLERLDARGNVDVTIGSGGSRNGQFDAPEDLAIASDGSIYVADSGNDRIQGFTPDGVFFKVINKSVHDKLSHPAALAMDDKDNLYVLDTGRNSVTVYNANGEPQREFGNDEKLLDARLDKPQGLLATQDEVFVLTNERVRVFSHDGTLLRNFGAPGEASGELARAVAIAARDADSFFIADRDVPRVQLFSTFYHPHAPQDVNAESAMHGVALHWQASPFAYVQQYVIYRAEKANGPWLPVAHSQATDYTDTDLTPDATYYYRVAAATAEGQEGQPGTAVSAVALKYTPLAPADIQAQAGISNAHLQWKALDTTLVPSYRVYQKDGDQYKQIGETAMPAFQIDNLEGGRAYTFWVTALSVDGVESEKQPVQVITQADMRAPLEIDASDLDNVFSNSYKMYETDGVGAAKLTNNTNATLKDIKVSFVLNNFMDFPTEQHIATLAPGASVDVTLKSVFNNNILTLTEDSPVQAKIEASYFENGQLKTYSQIKTVNIYEKHRLSWDERRRYAVFLTPKDPIIMTFTRSVVTANAGIKDPTQLAAALFDSLGVFGLTYMQDPNNPYQVTSNNVDVVDYVQYPRETLQRHTGDCDDLVGLYTAALESLGIVTRVLLVPGHMLMMFNTGVAAPADGYTMDDMYVVYEGMLWIPVETTLLGKSFTKAWESGASTYYKSKDKDGFDIFDVHEAWNTFKPATLSDDPWRADVVSRDAIEKRFPGDLTSVLNISSQTYTRDYMQTLQNNPDDVNAHLQVGIILARQGNRVEARKYFNKVLESQPNNAAALNDMGNLYMLDSQYEEAAKFYSAAANADPKDAEVWINLAQADKANKKITDAKQAFNQAQKLDSTVANRYKALGLELRNTMTNKPALDKKAPAQK